MKELTEESKKRMENIFAKQKESEGAELKDAALLLGAGLVMFGIGAGIFVNFWGGIIIFALGAILIYLAEK